MSPAEDHGGARAPSLKDAVAATLVGAGVVALLSMTALLAAGKLLFEHSSTSSLEGA